MSYRYEDQRADLFTEQGQRRFLKVRDRAMRLLKESGAGTAECLTGGDTWENHACLDRMVELGEIRCVYQKPGTIPMQCQVYVLVQKE